MQDLSPKFKNHFPSNTAILIVVLFLIASTGTWFFYKQKMALTAPSPTPSPVENARVALPTTPPSPILDATQSAVISEDIRLTGTIVENDPGCYADGVCSITVGNTKIILESGGDRMTQGAMAKGILLKKDGRSIAAIDELAVGKIVQVFGNQLDASTMTLYGKNEYYVKLLN